MAIIAGLITPLLGLTGIAAGIGEAIIGVGLSLGAGYLSSKLSPQPSTAAYPGMRLFVSYETNGPREIPFGIVADAGEFKYHNEYGPNGNDYVQFVYKLADVQCTSLEHLYVNGVLCTLGSHVSNGTVSGYSVNQYPGAMWVEFHDGAWDQSADADLVAKASGGEWQSTYRGRGVCYVRVTMKFDAKLYKAGRPNFLFVYKGAKLYDYRKDSSVGGSGAHRWGDESTYEWTDNVAVCLYNYKRGIYVNGSKVGGMNVPASSMPLDVWTASANACDEAVSLKAGGSEKRYRLNGLVPVNREHASVVRDMIAAMAGTPAESGGVFKFYAGVAQSPVLAITDDDLTSADEVTLAPKRSRSGLVNAVFGAFNDPAQLYKTSDLPPRISSADASVDGATELDASFGLNYVSSGTQGQRILEIFRRRGRFQRNVALKISAIGAILESGDWITWTSDRYGFNEVQFQVVQATLNRDFTVSLELQETSDSIYAWSAGSDELDQLNPHDVGSGGERFSTVQGVALSTIVVEAGGTIQRPGLHITWVPVDDATVTTLELEYRQVGSEAVLKDTILDPTAAQYTWVTGIQSGVEYEARMNLVTAPPRATVWSTWVSTESETAPQVVAVAALAKGVPPGAITPDKLDQQSRYLLRLIADTDEVLGAVDERIKAVTDRLSDSSEATIRALMAGDNNATDIRQERTQRVTATDALAQQITVIRAQLNDDVAAQINQIIQAYTAADTALASDIAEVTTALDGNISTVTVLTESVDGIKSSLTFALSANGAIVGLVDFAQKNGISAFNIDAGSFLVSLHDMPGGEAVPVFGMQIVNGSPKIALRGDMIADGSISTRHLNSVSISTLYISDPDNTYFWNFATGQDGRTDGTWLMDRKNATWDIIFGEDE